MKISITEEMRFRQRVVEYAIKNNNNALQNDSGTIFLFLCRIEQFT